MDLSSVSDLRSENCICFLDFLSIAREVDIYSDFEAGRLVPIVVFFLFLTIIGRLLTVIVKCFLKFVIIR
jgi:hypothetical protein